MCVDIPTVPISIGVLGHQPWSIGIYRIWVEYTLNSDLIFGAIGLHEPRTRRFFRREVGWREGRYRHGGKATRPFYIPFLGMLLKGHTRSSAVTPLSCLRSVYFSLSAYSISFFGSLN